MRHELTQCDGICPLIKWYVGGGAYVYYTIRRRWHSGRSALGSWKLDNRHHIQYYVLIEAEIACTKVIPVLSPFTIAHTPPPQPTISQASPISTNLYALLLQPIIATSLLPTPYNRHILSVTITNTQSHILSSPPSSTPLFKGILFNQGYLNKVGVGALKCLL